MGGCETGTPVSVEPTLKYHPDLFEVLTLIRESGSGTVHGGQFDWGGCLLKSTASALRSPQPGWKSGEECMSIRRLYCEGDIPISYESRFK